MEFGLIISPNLSECGDYDCSCVPCSMFRAAAKRHVHLFHALTKKTKSTSIKPSQHLDNIHSISIHAFLSDCFFCRLSFAFFTPKLLLLSCLPFQVMHTL